MAAPRASVVVINYNGGSHLARCLASIHRSGSQVDELIVVDDASTDDSCATLAATYSHARLVQHRRNRGPAAARNTGLREARNNLVCLLDNDVEVEPGWLEPLIETASQTPGLFACTPLVLRDDEPDTIGSCGGDVHFIGVHLNRGAACAADDPRYTQTHVVGAVVGICTLIRRDVLQPGMLFDEAFFYGFEEMDFCLSQRACGLVAAVDPRSRVRHKYKAGGTDGLTGGRSRYAPRRAFLIVRNRWYVVLKHYPAGLFVLAAPSLLLYELLSVAFLLKAGVFHAYLRAWASLIKNMPALLHRRRIVRRAAVVPMHRLLVSGTLSLTEDVVSSRFEQLVYRVAIRFFNANWRVITSILR